MRITKVSNLLLVISLICLGNACHASEVILILGDSLSTAYNIPKANSWVTLLKARLQQQNMDYQVQNASVAGITSGQSLDKLPGLLKQYNPQIVIVELGGNDGLRGTPLFMIRENLENIIQSCKNSNAQVLLIGIVLPSQVDQVYRDQFDQIYPELSSKFKVPLVPFLQASFVNDPSSFQEDHIHPAAKVQPQILENIWAYLAPMLQNP